MNKSIVNITSIKLEPHFTNYGAETCGSIKVSINFKSLDNKLIFQDVLLSFDFLTDELSFNYYERSYFKNGKYAKNYKTSATEHQYRSFVIEYTVLNWMKEDKEKFKKRKIKLLKSMLKNQKQEMIQAQSYIDILSDPTLKHREIVKVYSKRYIDNLYYSIEREIQINKILALL